MRFTEQGKCINNNFYVTYIMPHKVIDETKNKRPVS